jgi:hypothetical protein
VNARTSSAASGCSTTPLSRLPADAGTRTHNAGASADSPARSGRSVAPCNRTRQAIAGARLQRCRTFEKCKGHDALGLGRRADWPASTSQRAATTKTRHATVGAA